MNLLPCLACGAELEPAFKDVDDVVNQPYGGTVFTSHGQYGSTVWDPCGTGSEFLEITICDPCLVKHQDRVLKGRKIPRPSDWTYEPWVRS